MSTKMPSDAALSTADAMMSSASKPSRLISAMPMLLTSPGAISIWNTISGGGRGLLAL